MDPTMRSVAPATQIAIEAPRHEQAQKAAPATALLNAPPSSRSPPRPKLPTGPKPTPPAPGTQFPGAGSPQLRRASAPGSPAVGQRDNSDAALVASARMASNPLCGTSLTRAPPKANIGKTASTQATNEAGKVDTTKAASKPLTVARIVSSIVTGCLFGLGVALAAVALATPVGWAVMGVGIALAAVAALGAIANVATADKGQGGKVAMMMGLSALATFGSVMTAGAVGGAGTAALLGSAAFVGAGAAAAGTAAVGAGVALAGSAVVGSALAGASALGAGGVAGASAGVGTAATAMGVSSTAMLVAGGCLAAGAVAGGTGLSLYLDERHKKKAIDKEQEQQELAELKKKFAKMDAEMDAVKARIASGDYSTK